MWIFSSLILWFWKMDRAMFFWKNCSNLLRIDHLILITSLMLRIFSHQWLRLLLLQYFQMFCFITLLFMDVFFEYWYPLQFIWVFSISYFVNRRCSFCRDYSIYVCAEFINLFINFPPLFGSMRKFNVEFCYTKIQSLWDVNIQCHVMKCLSLPILFI